MSKRLRSTLSLKRDAKVRTLLLLEKKCKEKNSDWVCGCFFWKGILIRHCVGWHWKKRRI